MDLTRSRRRHWRRSARIAATAYGATAIPCTVTNISDAGACVNVPEGVPVDDSFSLFTGASAPMLACVVAWRSGGQVGVRFR